MTEETSQLLPQTLWHLLKLPINFISLGGDLITNVGSNFRQVTITAFNTSR